MLAQVGFAGLPAKTVGNAGSVVDVAGEDQVSFGAFLWFYDMISLAKSLFDAKAANGQAASAELADILTGMGYSALAARTVKALTLLTDQGAGHFVYSDLLNSLLFIRFALNLFGSLDTTQKGALTFDQFLPALPFFSITGATPEQARHIFDKYDLDHNGTMDAFEFIDLALSLKFPQLAQ